MNEKIPVSVIIMTKNEQIDLPKCLESVKSFSEVFVVDSGSIDKTLEIAETAGAKVVSFAWNGEYPKKKQWCLENCPFTNRWVLYVDADEVVYPALVEEIRGIMQTGPQHSGYFAAYDYVFLNRVLKHGHLVFKLVLFDRAKGFFEPKQDLEAKNAGEVELHFQPTINGSAGILKNRMLHHDCDDLFQYFDRHNRYSDWEAVLRAKNALCSNKDTQPGLRGFIKTVFDKLPCRWAVAFFHSYFLKFGFLDGLPGLYYAMSRAFYYWQIEAKIFDLKHRDRQ